MVFDNSWLPPVIPSNPLKAKLLADRRTAQNWGGGLDNQGTAITTPGQQAGQLSPGGKLVPVWQGSDVAAAREGVRLVPQKPPVVEMLLSLLGVTEMTSCRFLLGNDDPLSFA